MAQLKLVYIIWPDGSRNEGFVVASPRNSNLWKRGKASDFINDLNSMNDGKIS